MYSTTRLGSPSVRGAVRNPPLPLIILIDAFLIQGAYQHSLYSRIIGPRPIPPHREPRLPDTRILVRESLTGIISVPLPDLKYSTSRGLPCIMVTDVLSKEDINDVKFDNGSLLRHANRSEPPAHGGHGRGFFRT